MRTSKRVALILGLFALAMSVAAQEKGGEDLTGPYEVVANWPQPLHNDGWS